MSTLADRLRAAIAARPGATQAGLARHCNVRPPSVSDWLRAETVELKASSLVKAAEYLGVRARWLLDGSGPMRNDGNQQEHAAPSLEQALRRLGAELAMGMDDEAREDVADALHKLAMRRGSDRDQALVLHLLRTAGPNRKRAAAA